MMFNLIFIAASLSVSRERWDIIKSYLIPKSATELHFNQIDFQSSGLSMPILWNAKTRKSA